MAQNYNGALKAHLAYEKQTQERERLEMMQRFKNVGPSMPIS